MWSRRFNNHHKTKKCPICNYSTGKLLPQEGPLRDLGYPGAHYAHIICVVEARARQKESPHAVPEVRDRAVIRAPDLVPDRTRHLNHD